MARSIVSAGNGDVHETHLIAVFIRLGPRNAGNGHADVSRTERQGPGRHRPRHVPTDSRVVGKELGANAENSGLLLLGVDDKPTLEMLRCPGRIGEQGG